MYIVLEKEDCVEFATAIYALSQKDGSMETIECWNNSIEFEVRFALETNGYYENDYQDGTGAWVTTDVSFVLYDISVKDSVYCSVSYDSNIIENKVRELFN